MHIVVGSVGTRGDVQPYVALGIALKERGHQVTIATHDDHRDLVESHGLALRAVCGSFRDLMDSSAGRAWLDSGASPFRYIKALRQLFAPLAAQWLADFDAAFANADAVLANATSSSALIAARGRGLPCFVMAPFGSIPSRAFDMGLPELPVVTPWLNRVMHGAAIDQFWKVGEREALGYFTKRGVAKPRMPLWRELVQRSVPHLHMYSEHVLPRPKDWPECAEVLGYCFLDAPAAWKPAPKLVAFLAAGSTPIYVGFGSMTGMQPERLARLTAEALRASKTRAVVAMGWGGMKDFEASDDVLVIDDAPHEWLLPRVAAAVHHCGAGTTAAVLRADKPSVAVPFFGDQPFWARTLHALGTAPPPIPKSRLTAARLAAAITQAKADPRYATRASTIGAAIRAESGASRAAERVLHHLREMTGS